MKTKVATIGLCILFGSSVLSYGQRANLVLLPSASTANPALCRMERYTSDSTLNTRKETGENIIRPGVFQMHTGPILPGKILLKAFRKRFLEELSRSVRAQDWIPTIPTIPTIPEVAAVPAIQTVPMVPVIPAVAAVPAIQTIPAIEQNDKK